MSEEQCSEELYARAQDVWSRLNCHTLGDYHDVYLLTDVGLLADVFDNFREMALQYYGLDPAHYLTLPHFSWDAMLKFTGVELELLSDLVCTTWLRVPRGAEWCRLVAGTLWQTTNLLTQIPGQPRILLVKATT